MRAIIHCNSRHALVGGITLDGALFCERSFKIALGDVDLVDLAKLLGDELELVVESCRLLMTSSVSVCLESQDVATPVTQETRRAIVVENFHRGPLCLTEVAKVLLHFASLDCSALHFLVDGVHSPFDSVDCLAIVDVVIRSVARSRVVGSLFGSGMSAKISESDMYKSIKGNSSLHCKEPVLSELSADFVQVFCVYGHEIRKIVISKACLQC